MYWKWPGRVGGVSGSPRGGFPEVVNGQSGPYWSGAKWNPSCVFGKITSELSRTFPSLKERQKGFPRLNGRP